ncbi:MAG: GtrA family protein [Promethearchaeota archaeon]
MPMKKALSFISRNFIKELFKFAFVGFLGAILNLILLFIFTEFLQIHYLLSEIFAIFFATIHNYLLNKLWTFKEKLEENLIIKLLKYGFTAGVSFILNIAILYFLVEYFKIWYITAAAIAIATTFIWNFFSNKYWTFKRIKQDI